MKPLIFAVDVKLSLQGRALKTAMEDLFRELHDLREESVTPHVLPTGDGAILVWPAGKDDEPGQPQRIIVKVLTALKGWSERAGNARVRIGIHCDSELESIQIAGQPSLFGPGISRCIRYQAAADPNQALLSDAAREDLQISQSTPGLDLGKPFAFFDRPGRKHVAWPVGLRSVTHWTLSPPSSSEQSSVRAELRDKEQPANNAFLQAAHTATIVALTYKTLGIAFTDKKNPLRLEEVKKAQLCVFSLPVLKHGHPVIKNAHILEEEWKTGVCRTVEGFLSRKKCPMLEHLELIVLSATPLLTATVTSRKNERGVNESILRYHPIIEGLEPEHIPTFILNHSEEETSPLFDAFDSMIENIGRNPPRLKFAMRDGKYTRTNIQEFVENLKIVCNHSRYKLQDRSFRAQWRGSVSGEKLTPEIVYGSLDGHRRTNDLLVEWNGAGEHEVVISSRRANGTTTPIAGAHIMAFFVLMTWRSKVVLVFKHKPGWTHDVPGGKVAEADKDGHDTVHREVFEELGLVLDRERLGDPLGAVYDPRSAKENGVPVVAQYYSYPLDHDEYRYLFDVARHTTKGEPLVLYPLDQLLREKTEHTAPLEAICHAPLAVIKNLAAELR